MCVTQERHEFATSSSPNSNKIRDYNEGDLMKIKYLDVLLHESRKD